VNEEIIYQASIRLDFHKEKIAVAIASPEPGSEIHFWEHNDNAAIATTELFNKLKNRYRRLLICYDADPCGDKLYHQLTTKGIERKVVTESRSPRLPIDRTKIGTHDALTLAVLLRAGI